jgi:hypothetical protein
MNMACILHIHSKVYRFRHFLFSMLLVIHSFSFIFFSLDFP